jgi:hypothetical protein
MVTLETGESVIKTGPVRWVGREGERPGVLTLTNHAILFEGPIPQALPGAGPGPPGPMRGRPWAAQRAAGPPRLVAGTLRIPLWRCRGAASIPGPSGSDLGIQLLQRSLLLRTGEADIWAPAIRQARASAPPPPPGMMGGHGAGAPANLHCEYCDRPSPPGSLKCVSCGAPFQD